MKIPIIATGMSGLVGTRVQELLNDNFEFTDLSLTNGIDITNLEEIEKVILDSPAKIILHMAAKTDVDGCEEDKIFGEEGTAWQINVVGTENIVRCAENSGKHIIYISTDFVFDGTKDSYSENDTPNPVNWYGRTKWEGEELILNSKTSGTIVRLAYPYRAYFPERKDFVRRIIEKLTKGEKISGLTDHIFTPTFIDDIAFGLKLIFEKQLYGIYHLTGSQSMSVNEGIKLIAEKFNFKAKIESVLRKDYFKNRAFRPFKLALKNDKIKELGINMMSFNEGLTEVKKQLSSFS